MMIKNITQEEAIKQLDTMWKMLTSAYDDIADSHVVAYTMAVEALEKQIPKKPVMGYAFGEKLREVIKRTDPERAESKTECCPVCGRTLGVSQFVKTQTGLRVGDPHCKRCGQTIDWGTDE